jgi:hypothetical protein
MTVEIIDKTTATGNFFSTSNMPIDESKHFAMSIKPGFTPNCPLSTLRRFQENLFDP